MTGSTHANHRGACSPRPTLEAPARDNPIAGPRTATTRSEPSAPASTGASGRHNEPGYWPASACPAQPPSKARGASPRAGERHHAVGKADLSTESNRTGQGAATRHAREASRRPQQRHTDRCQATTAAGCRKPGQCAQHATNHGTRAGAKQHQPPSVRACARPAANPAPAGYGTVPSGWTSVRQAAYPAPASYETAAVRMDVCALGGYPALAGYE